MELQPTNTCFDDALDFLDHLLREAADLGREDFEDRFVLVHGICRCPEGELYAHAWVEQDGALVWQAGLAFAFKVYVSQRAQEFYAERRVVEFTRYTVKEAIAINDETGHYGPWKEKYRRLCKNARERSLVG